VSPGQRLDWADTLKIVDRLERFLSEGSAPLLVRLLRALKFIDLLGQATFEKIRGARLGGFLEIIAGGCAGEVPADLTTIPPPSGTGRMQFRLLAGQYARKDTFATTGWRNRWRLFVAALRLARGKGMVPPLQEVFVEVPFETLETEFGPIPAEAEAI